MLASQLLPLELLMSGIVGALGVASVRKEWLEERLAEGRERHKGRNKRETLRRGAMLLGQ
jgi:hypothetical protein